MDNMHCDLSRARLEQAKQCIRSAMILAENGDYRVEANRSYYAIFHQKGVAETRDFSHERSHAFPSF